MKKRGSIKKYFMTGLVILLPLVITLSVILFIVNTLTKPFVGIVSRFLVEHGIVATGFWIFSSKQVLRYSSETAIIAALFFFTISLGIVTRWFFVNTLLRWSDYVLHKIPLVSSVYKTCQEIIKTVLGTDKTAFRQVVMVPFPKTGVYVLGLIAREAPQECSTAAGAHLTSVFVPTTPNPTTGFLLMYKQEDIIPLEMTPEEAIKCIVSCGVMHPEKKGEKK